MGTTSAVSPSCARAVADYYDAAGLPTTPEHILVTHGAQHGLALTLRLLRRVGRSGARRTPDVPERPGRRSPRRRQARPRGHGRGAWLGRRDAGSDDSPIGATAGLPRSRLSEPDRTSDVRHRYGSRSATLLRHTRTPVVIDETLRDLPLAADGGAPAIRGRWRSCPIRSSASDRPGKSFWGGLRVGWLRASPSVITRLAAIRSSIDLGSPVLEQLVVLFLLRDASSVLEPRQRTHSARPHHPDASARRASAGSAVSASRRWPVAVGRAGGIRQQSSRGGGRAARASARRRSSIRCRRSVRALSCAFPSPCRRSSSRRRGSTARGRLLQRARQECGCRDVRPWPTTRGLSVA